MGSFVEMPAEKVRELAQACLDHINEQRQRDKTKAIAERRKAHEKSWLRWLFNWKVPSDEEIWKELCGSGSADDPYWDSAAFFIMSYAWGSEKVAKNLLKAAKHSVVVHVSVDDLKMIT